MVKRPVILSVCIKENILVCEPNTLDHVLCMSSLLKTRIVRALHRQALNIVMLETVQVTLGLLTGGENKYLNLDKFSFVATSDGCPI